MPEVVKIKIWRFLLKPLEKAIFVYLQHRVAILFENVPEETLRWGKKYFAVENIHVIAEGVLVNPLAPEFSFKF